LLLLPAAEFVFPLAQWEMMTKIVKQNRTPDRCLTHRSRHHLSITYLTPI